MATAERAETSGGRWAAAERAWGEMSASAGGSCPSASVGPNSSTVRVFSGAGSTLTVTSVITPSVPRPAAATVSRKAPAPITSAEAPAREPYADASDDGGKTPRSEVTGIQPPEKAVTETSPKPPVLIVRRVQAEGLTAGRDRQFPDRDRETFRELLRRALGGGAS